MNTQLLLDKYVFEIYHIDKFLSYFLFIFAYSAYNTDNQATQNNQKPIRKMLIYCVLFMLYNQKQQLAMTCKNKKTCFYTRLATYEYYFSYVVPFLL